MADYKNVTDLPIMDEVTENTHVIVEDGGDFKRVSGDKLGGGMKTAIIRSSNYLDAIAGVQAAVSASPAVTFECINMTFAEAYETMAKGEVLNVMGQVVSVGAMCTFGMIGFIGTELGVPALMVLLMSVSDAVQLYWTEDGLSTDAPETEE